MKPYLLNMALKENLKTTSPSKYRNFSFIFLLVIASSLLFGCNETKNPYFPAEIIPQEIIKICKNEYNLDVKVSIVEDTLWLYIPLKRFVDQAGKVDQDFLDTLNHVVLSINRVLMSTKSPPKFYLIFASDIKELGADYISAGYVLDVKKYLYHFISREEFLRRQVANFSLNPEALGDLEGKHVEFFNVTLDSFILAQIEQRIASRLGENDISSKIKIEKLESIPERNNIKFVLNLKGTDKYKYDIDFTGMALKIISYVFFAYDFKDFENITIVDSYSGKQNTYSRKSLEDFR